MSKYSEAMTEQFQDIKKVRELTRDTIKQGTNLAFREVHGANYEKLVESIRKS